MIIFHWTEWKLSKYKKNSTKNKTFVEIWRPFWKKRPHGFIHHWDFCRQPDFNSPMTKVTKNSGLQKSPGGAGFRLLAHIQKQVEIGCGLILSFNLHCLFVALLLINVGFAHKCKMKLSSRCFFLHASFKKLMHFLKICYKSETQRSYDSFIKKKKEKKDCL